MRKYEILLLLQPDLKSEEKEKILDEIEKIISGQIVIKEDWGVKKLAYPIKKKNDANYLLYYVEAMPENIVELKKALLIKKEIMREMILKHEKNWPYEVKSTKDIVFHSRRNTNKKRTNVSSTNKEIESND